VVTSRERVCEVCGKPLLTYQQKYCSKKCYGKANRGKNSPHWKGGPISTACDNCERPITLERAAFNSREHHFCCDNCYRLWFGRVFRGENASNWRGGPLELNCQVCGNGFQVIPSRCKDRNVSFCSMKCKGIAMSRVIGEKTPNWRGGISFEPYGSEFNDALKEMIRNRDNRECQYCGISESTLGKKLDVHHISYSKIDNHESNLISLCSSCHAKTHGHRRFFWEAYFKMRIQEKDSVQSRLHLIPQQE